MMQLNTETNKSLKLYKLIRANNTPDYTYQDIIVAAYNPEDAKTIRPNDNIRPEDDTDALWPHDHNMIYYLYLGEASPKIERGLILAAIIHTPFIEPEWIDLPNGGMTLDDLVSYDMTLQVEQSVLIAGNRLMLDNGEIIIIGNINELGGTCDCCQIQLGEAKIIKYQKNHF